MNGQEGRTEMSAPIKPHAAQTRATHTCIVVCAYCLAEFDLFEASWCTHTTFYSSKVCPYCKACLCKHPLYREPSFWKDAPIGFQKEGFRKLFLFYLGGRPWLP